MSDSQYRLPLSLGMSLGERWSRARSKLSSLLNQNQSGVAHVLGPLMGWSGQ